MVSHETVSREWGFVNGSCEMEESEAQTGVVKMSRKDET